MDARDEQVMDATYCFGGPRTAVLRRALLERPRSPGAIAGLLFPEAWEGQLAPGIAAILRARQLRWANPALAVGLRSELARARPLARPARRRPMPHGGTEGRTGLDRGAADTSPRVIPTRLPQPGWLVEVGPVPPGSSDLRRDRGREAIYGERGSGPGRPHGP